MMCAPPFLSAVRMALSNAGLQSLMPFPLAPACSMFILYDGILAPVIHFSIESRLASGYLFTANASIHRTDIMMRAVILFIPFILLCVWLFVFTLRFFLSIFFRRHSVFLSETLSEVSRIVETHGIGNLRDVVVRCFDKSRCL